MSQLPLFRQLLFEFLDWREEVAHFFDAGDYHVRAEFQEIGFFLFQTVHDLVPSDRSRNGRLFPSAERIDTNCRFVFVVLAPIDEHFSFAHRLRHIRRDKIAVFAFEMLGKGAR